MIPAIGKRVHFIRAAGGFKTDYYYTQKQNSVVLDAGEQALADIAAALLAARPGTHISVTSPMNLLEEIFTVKGAGTLFRKGSVIVLGVRTLFSSLGADVERVCRFAISKLRKEFLPLRFFWKYQKHFRNTSGPNLGKISVSPRPLW